MKDSKVFLILIIALTIMGSSINIVSPYKATITRIEGTVLKKINPHNIWIPVNKGDILDSGDSLKTRENSYAELRFSDGSIVKISPDTEVSIYKDYISLAIGYIKLYITKLFPNFEVRTPSAIAGVRGTEFSVEVLEDQTTIVTVYEGEVDLTAQGRTLRLRKGESGIVRPKSPPEINPASERRKEEKLEQYQHRQEGKSSGKDGDNRPKGR